MKDLKAKAPKIRAMYLLSLMQMVILMLELQISLQRVFLSN